MKKKILFITGSMNQTVQMHQIAAQLMDEYDCWFSQIFADKRWIRAVIQYTNLGDSIIISNPYRTRSERYLRQNGLQIDYRAQKNEYDLVVYCSDMVLPKRMKAHRTIWVQEGMIDKYNWKSAIVQKLRMAAFWSSDTSLNGSTNHCDVYCAASEGYKNYFTMRGTEAHKILVTGMPNFDNLDEHRQNDFQHRDYVMVATSDMRETFRYENRVAFIQEAVKIAAGRRLLFKLHPNEKWERALAEIREHAPADTLVFQSGNTNDMIANCTELITQYSTVVYVGIALGKKVHSYFDIGMLYRLAPWQNGGTSAENIARIARAFVEFEGHKSDFIRLYQYEAVPVEVEYPAPLQQPQAIHQAEEWYNLNGKRAKECLEW